MSATIFRHEFRTRLRSVITWSLAQVCILFLFFSFFSAFADQAELLNDMMSRFPPELLAAFGMNRMNLATVLGFYSLIFLFCQLLLSIQAGNYGFGLVSIEESELTADFLLSKPVSRGQVLNSKLLAALASLFITDLVIALGSLIAIELFRAGRTYALSTVLLMLSSLLLFQLFFLSVGLVISLLVKRVRSVTPYALGLAFGAYVLNAFSGMLGDVTLEKITPFKHFDAARMVQVGGLDTPLVLINLAVSLLALGISYWLYLRRDIPAVS